ncbi:uncharacterized protein LOC111808905 [Cucurbita pepo subsp. pepo]|uniref:uncharacterized protein LOC111808905 n=1 Tax=Cucurbita pepo subsp. pepo TaxID=3664 RepID=UPI000C9D84DA|nr:uncharacterized protein LOC111808905 [Cucurbita pepo subsp. pepo]
MRALRQDTVIWVPEVLPKEKAVVHKEDLVIWPPVIIVCNIFLSHSNPDKRRVVTIEALESFLRSKNLLRGRVKMNLRVSCRSKCNGVEVPVLVDECRKTRQCFSERRGGRVSFELAGKVQKWRR